MTKVYNTTILLESLYYFNLLQDAPKTQTGCSHCCCTGYWTFTLWLPTSLPAPTVSTPWRRRAGVTGTSSLSTSIAPQYSCSTPQSGRNSSVISSFTFTLSPWDFLYSLRLWNFKLSSTLTVLKTTFSLAVISSLLLPTQVRNIVRGSRRAVISDQSRDTSYNTTLVKSLMIEENTWRTQTMRWTSGSTCQIWKILL